MGTQIRDKDPTIYRLLTTRTQEARLFMIPTTETRELIGGIVARYQEILNVEIFTYNFLTNHPHMLVRAPLGNIDEFCENVNREIARRMNWKLMRKGKFWGKRYADQDVPSDNDLLEAFLYITTNAVHHGLVPHPKLWPGLSSYQQSITETDKKYIFHHYSARGDEPQFTEHTLKLSPLPQYAELTPKKRKQVIRKLIEDRTQFIVDKRLKNNQGFLGIEAILRQDPFSQPREISNSPRPCCYSKDPEIIRQKIELLRLRRDAYSWASMKYRLGDMDAVFPSFSFKPPLHRKPRLRPFEVLPDDYFKNVA